MASSMPNLLLLESINRFLSVFMAESLRALPNPGSVSLSAAGQGKDLF
jgi:hypothetical protein